MGFLPPYVGPLCSVCWPFGFKRLTPLRPFLLQTLHPNFHSIRKNCSCLLWWGEFWEKSATFMRQKNHAYDFISLKFSILVSFAGVWEHFTFGFIVSMSCLCDPTRKWTCFCRKSKEESLTSKSNEKCLTKKNHSKSFQPIFVPWHCGIDCSQSHISTGNGAIYCWRIEYTRASAWAIYKFHMDCWRIDSRTGNNRQTLDDQIHGRIFPFDCLLTFHGMPHKMHMYTQHAQRTWPENSNGFCVKFIN